MIKPVVEKHFILPENAFPKPGAIGDELKYQNREKIISITVNNRFDLKLTFAWLFVGIPLIWGVTQIIFKSLTLLTN